MFASKDIFLKSSGGGAYQISRSVRLRSSASAYLNRTFSSTGNTKTWTWSAWFKRGTLGTEQNLFGTIDLSVTNRQCYISFQTDNTLTFSNYTTSGYNYYLQTTQVFRDPSAWYHIVCVSDTSQATTANRLKIYVNGIQITAFSTATYPSQNFDGWVNANTGAGVQLGIGRVAPYVSGQYFDGYMTEINFIDGQALTPSSFGETNAITGVWQPKKYAGTYGTNGFYLNFSDNSTAAALGTDFSGNSNTWTVNNISVTAGATYDSMLDVPTPYADGGNGRGNYATLNPISMAGSTATLSKGNLSFTNSGTHARRASSISMSSGKWYAEATITTVGGSYPIVGIATTSTFNGATYVGADSTSYGYSTNATKYNNAVAVSYGATYTTNDVIGIALDLDAGTLVFYKNNVSQGTAYSSLSGEFTFAVSGLTGTVWELNFGQRPFTYTPPTGFVALNTQNLPTPTISNGANYMAATTYTGTGAALSVSNAVNGISFQPDFVWTKPRSTAVGHTLFDSLRGVTKYLQSNTTGAEGTAATSLTAFNSNGFTVNSDTSTGANGVTYIGWQWNAGGSTVTNTSGSISAQVRANATAGFSVVTYTGNGVTAATVGHGLNAIPAMVIIKERGTAGTNWMVKHQSLASSNNLFLQGTNATTNITTAVGGGGIANLSSSTTFNFLAGTSNTDNVNRNTGTFVAYCFAAVAGYSAFGSYTGNGSADGPFVYTGFRPRFVMIKRTDTAGENWLIWDSSRDTYNAGGLNLFPNLSNAENNNAPDFDFLSNGFKLRKSAAQHNASGGTYIFMAVAENPFKLSLAR
jgi:hypothetical protein